MSTITSLGTGSGLDLESLVTKLMAVESAPLSLLQTKQASYETKISAMGKLNSALAALQTAAANMKTSATQTAIDKYSTYTATVANTSVADATATTGAASGSFSLEVTQLAASQTIKSSAYTASTAESTLKIELGSVATTGTTKAFTANSSATIKIAANATLEQVRTAINKAATGVTASIIVDKNGAQQLVLSGPEGTKNTMRLSGTVSGLSYDPEGGTDGSTYGDFSEITPAKDAKFLLNGIETTSSSNTVTGNPSGVTLNLKATNEGSATTLKITSESATSIKSSLEAFITAYNSATTTMKSLGAYNATTKVSGDLQGNGTLRSAMAQLRSAVFGTTSGNDSSTYQILSDIGVTVGSDGKLTLDTTKDKLTTAITNDASTVSDLVANIGKSFNTIIDGLIGTKGTVTTATSSLNQSVSDLEKSQEKMQIRLAAIEKQYRAKFTALDTLIGNLTTTGNYITNYISSLSSSSSK